MNSRETVGSPGSGSPATRHETIALPGLAPLGVPGAALRGAGELSEELLAASVWTDEMVAAAGIPIVDAPFVSIGGGLGSFVMADYLRVAGVPAASIKVLSTLDTPWQTYQYLAAVSQIPEWERLRSDSQSTPDNPWGFPSYAFREAFAQRRPTKFLAPLWQVLTEPVLTDYFTPQSSQVFAGLRREADRIGWWEMVAKGQARMVRRRLGGGYFSILTPPRDGSSPPRVAYRGSYVHLAVGYPGVRFLPDLQEYRRRTGDVTRVVNAYEPHDHVYEELLRRPGTVVLRGGGIVASRILQRLIEDRENNGALTTIDHLFRTFVTGAHGPNAFMRRKGGDGWSYQGFNWPKATWGGQLKARLERADPEERKRLYSLFGGTTTPKRRLWQEQLARARAGGWYKTFVGEVTGVNPGPQSTVVTRIRTRDGTLEVPAQYVIDATGLEADIREHRLLADLLDHTGAETNFFGRLAVERSFEVKGVRNDTGRLYASGSATLGGPYCGVDSFLGLQYAALTISDDLARAGFCRRIGPARSTAQWWRWVLNRPVR
jgi:hypothetical protein